MVIRWFISDLLGMKTSRSIITWIASVGSENGTGDGNFPQDIAPPG